MRKSIPKHTESIQKGHQNMKKREEIHPQNPKKEET
jgi:hypothetical protein